MGMISRRSFVLGAGLTCAAGLMLNGCAGAFAQDGQLAATLATATQTTTTNTGNGGALALDNKAWRYDASSDTYYQLGIPYCALPAAPSVQRLAILVPSAYLQGTKNEDEDTYTCAVDPTGTVGAFSAQTAPIALPLSSTKYEGQEPLTEFSTEGVATYLAAGLICVLAGFRGSTGGTNADGSTYVGGAPWGLIDCKAALRWLRYNAEDLPGDAENVFAIGRLGGGGMATLLASSGDAPQFNSYLECIGAAFHDSAGNTISDAVTGCAGWDPLLVFDNANAAYEWEIGQFTATDARQEGSLGRQLSIDLCNAYVSYVNMLNLNPPSSQKAAFPSQTAPLTLEAGEDGRYMKGTYADYLRNLVQDALNEFLLSVSFPLTANSTRYTAAANYIAALNEDITWLTYDASNNTVTVLNLEGLARCLGSNVLDVCPFDPFDKSSDENALFADEDSNSRHYDKMLSDVLRLNASEYATFGAWDSGYPEAYEQDLDATDSEGVSTKVRARLFNPMFFASGGYEGFESATVAPYWRVRVSVGPGATGLNALLATRANLACSLVAREDVSSVDFSATWTTEESAAEETDALQENVVSWIQSIH